jgi:opacity protein-like surface antigen
MTDSDAEISMMRVTKLVLLWMALLVAGASMAEAQTTPAGDEGRYYVGGAVGATLGNKSGFAGGVELGGRITEQIEGFLEFGRMRNVATTDVEARASLIASHIQASASTVQKATYFAIGGKYRGPVFAGMWRPYIGFGVGVAKVETVATFVVNGTDVTAQLLPLYGVALGNDLSDSLNKVFITVPIGVQGTFLKRYVIDGSYRFGRILAKPDDIDRDVSINAQRIQFGFGVRF